MHCGSPVQILGDDAPTNLPIATVQCERYANVFVNDDDDTSRFITKCGCRLRRDLLLVDVAVLCLYRGAARRYE